MENIGIILKRTLNKFHISPKTNKAKVFLNYDKAVGEDIAKVSQPTSFTNNTLFIGVKNPAWSHQLYFFKSDIIDKINFDFEEPVVKDIKFHIKRLDKKPYTKKTVKKNRKITVPDKKLKMVYNISSVVKDEELREKFKQFMLKDIKYKIQKGGK